MNIKKILNNLHYLLIITIIGGWILNGKYYYSRFQSEGFAPWLQIVIPIMLVVFASVCFSMGNYLKQKQPNKLIWILFFVIYGILAFYSVNCTTAGQYWDQVVKNQETEMTDNVKDNSMYLVERYKTKIAEKEAEYKKLNEIKDNSISDLSDLYGFKNTSKTVEEMKDKIEADIKEYVIELEKILNKNMISVKENEKQEKSRTLYEFYAGKNGNPDVIQFIFQVMLSIIIELIAQISIYIFMIIEGERNKNEKNIVIEIESENGKKDFYTNFDNEVTIKKPEPDLKVLYPDSESESEIEPLEYWNPSEINISGEELKYFSIIAWEFIHREISKYLADKNIILENMPRYKQYDFNEAKYEKIIEIALQNKLIKKSGNNYVQFNEFTNNEYFIRRMKEILNLT